MHSPKHTPNLYRLARAVGKPVTQVADDLIAFAFKELGIVRKELDDQEISKIIQGCEEKENDNDNKA